MIVTPRMWALQKRLDFLNWLHKCDPGDYMIEFERNELQIKLNKLATIERIGLKLVPNCGTARQTPSSSTEKVPQSS